MDEVIKRLPYDCDVYCCSDSMAVLSYSNYNIFISNRVSEIQTIINKMKWHHVPTNVNPTDILSRGSSNLGITYTMEQWS